MPCARAPARLRQSKKVVCTCADDCLHCRPEQAHRIAHELWTRGRKVMAAALQVCLRRPDLGAGLQTGLGIAPLQSTAHWCRTTEHFSPALPLSRHCQP